MLIKPLNPTQRSIHERVTGGNGRVKLNVNLLVGKYIITSCYNGANIANTITITA